MSMRTNPAIPTGKPEARVFNFAAALALKTPVVGTDSLTGQEFFNVQGINSILRIVENQTLSEVAQDYIYEILRDGTVIARFYSNQLKSDQQFVPEVFPYNLGGGLLQIRATQMLGALEARVVTVTFQKPLV